MGGLGGSGNFVVTVESVQAGIVSTLFALGRNQLLNRLNAIHFQDGSLFVSLRHKKHAYPFRLQATPHPAEDEHIKATWHKDTVFPPDLKAFTLESIIIPGPQRTFSFNPERYLVDTDAFRFELPNGADEITKGKCVRYDYQDYQVFVPYFRQRKKRMLWHGHSRQKSAEPFKTCQFNSLCGETPMSRVCQ